MSINERLFFLLDTKEISQAELSCATGIPSQTISGWKNRKTDPPAYLIPVIADFLKISCDFLLKGDSCENIPEFLKCDATSSIGKRIRELRKSVNMSQDALGYIVKKNGTTVGRYEKDELPVPSDVLEILSNHFNVSIDYIVLGKTKGIQELDKSFDRTTFDALTLLEHLSVSDQQEIIEIMQFKLYKRGQEWDVLKLL